MAIFTGQIAAALAAGNGVIAKPAEQSPLTAWFAVKLLHQAGVPKDVLQFLPGSGASIGNAIVADARVRGVCFTGSTETAQQIHRTLADHSSPQTPLIAETGGLNAMIVDSTALPEQAIRDIVDSAFRSAGQRCSALRILYVQEEVAPSFLEMLFGAIDELLIGDPWQPSTDIGPVIDAEAAQQINAYIDRARQDNRVLKQLDVPESGCFVRPCVIEIDSLSDLRKEVFGPVLHVVRFQSWDVNKIIGDINASGYGLTFGLHTRIDDRVDSIAAALKVGNIYINRNQIGAIVGSQPFGGEGLSGTGPKAGGPNYLHAFTRPDANVSHPVAPSRFASTREVQTAIAALAPSRQSALTSVELPGPTGESNQLSHYARGPVLCLGPTPNDAAAQAKLARDNGCAALIVCEGAREEGAISAHLDRDALATLRGFFVVALWSDDDDLRAARRALAKRSGPIIPLAVDQDLARLCLVERHVCIDTTASGGNASLLAGD